MNNTDLIENSVNEISKRISDIENKYFSLAGERLNKIYGMTSEQLKDYFYSADFVDGINSDLKAVRKLLEKAHKDNTQAMKLLADGLTNGIEAHG